VGWRRPRTRGRRRPACCGRARAVTSGASAGKVVVWVAVIGCAKLRGCTCEEPAWTPNSVLSFVRHEGQPAPSDGDGIIALLVLAAGERALAA
jgi:hypothetical protein